MKTLIAVYMSGARRFITRHGWLLALAAFLCIIHFNHTLNGDEGITLNAAWRISQGERPYQDFFEFVGPASPYLVAGWWKITGVSYAAAKLLFVLLLAGACLCLEWLARQFGAGRLAKVPAFLFAASSAFAPVINHNTLAVVLVIYATSLFFIFWSQHSRSALIASGLVTSVSILTVQNRGLALLAVCSLALFWLLIKKKEMSSLLYWIAACIIPLLLIFLVWPPALLWNDLILYPFKNYPATNQVPLTMWLGAMLFSILLYVLARRQKSSYIPEILLAIQTALLLSILSRADISHLLPILFPAYILLALVLHSYTRSIQATRLIFAITTLACLPIALIGLTRLAATPPPALYAAAARCQGNTLYAGPFLSGLYFEFRKLPTTPYSFLITNQQTAEQFSDAAQLLAAQPPTCVFLDYAMVEKFKYTRDNPVDTFILEHYTPTTRFGPLTLLLLNSQ